MTRTRYRWLVPLLVAALVVTAGCGAADSPTEPKTDDPQSGYVQAEVVDTMPANATVLNYSGETVGASETLETALRRAVEANDSVRVPLDGNEIDRVYAALDDVPEGGSDGLHYVRYDGTVVEVVVPVAG